MNFRLLFRSLVFLAILFVMLYAGMYNTQPIEFAFPVLLAKNIREPAAIIFFCVFAIGLLGGTVLTAGGRGRGGASREK
jgi:uncharacterized integral membrane protein